VVRPCHCLAIGHGTPPQSLPWGSPDPLLASLRRLPMRSLWLGRSDRMGGTTAICCIQLCVLSSTSSGSAGMVLCAADPGYRNAVGCFAEGASLSGYSSSATIRCFARALDA
jgi:hypothetical protein